MTELIVGEYYCAGGNRHSAAADWSAISGRLAFGADHNIGLWTPRHESIPGLSTLLGGHLDKVSAVKFLSTDSEPSLELLLSGSADGELRLWKWSFQDDTFLPVANVAAHVGTVNVITSLGHDGIFATGGADAKVKIWQVVEGALVPRSEILLKPRFIPLALAMGRFPENSGADSAFLAAGGTRNDVQVYAIESLTTSPLISLSATLTGHEAWIRSLALTPDRDGGFLLASASQDKYVRVWRFSSEQPQLMRANGNASAQFPSNSNLTSKVQSVSAGGGKYFVSFEALLLGHEDWIYSCAWKPNAPVPQLLTASADGSLSIWEPEETSGVWVSISRLGEISGQKGATTATGSSGGFWIGLWSPDGSMVTCLGRTGSWRLWQFVAETQFWRQRHAVSGHVGSVDGICWAPDGSYLLSTSADQTTRLHAEWKREEKITWHEFSRPQIHGYDLNCIASTTPHQFVSGADEKLLRVFNEPKDVADMLHKLCQVPLPSEGISLPDTAAIPVLGLSNKAMGDGEDVQNDEKGNQGFDDNVASERQNQSLADLDEPPTEDLLSRHTLWPEHEKLYGHGYEISEVAAPIDGSLLATACKASSIDHAVVRLYDTVHWSEMRPPLTAHSLTVTRLAISITQPKLILSVGRDRQWAVYGQTDPVANSWNLVASNPKAHSRMILDCAWLSNTAYPSFVTAGRDKVLRLWASGGSRAPFEFSCMLEIKRRSAITAVATVSDHSRSVLAAGEEDGTISIHTFHHSDVLEHVESFDVGSPLSPARTVNRLAWRPGLTECPFDQLAVASAEGSVRILRFNWKAY